MGSTVGFASAKSQDGPYQLGGKSVVRYYKKRRVANLESWEPISRTYLSQNYIRRDLADDITDCPAGLHVVELVAV